MKRPGSMISRILAAGILLVFAASFAFAAGPAAPRKKTTDKVVSPESVGMDGAVLSEGIARAIKGAMDAKAVPGAVVLVARHGQICYHEAFGEMKPGFPMTKDAIFSLVSMSKTPIAVAAMQLVDQGRILLTDPISMYIPEFANMKVAEKASDGSIRLVPAKRPITLHDLLNMTSGIFRPVNATGDRAVDAYTGDPVKDFVAETLRDAGIRTGTGDLDQTAKQVAMLAAKIPLIFHPGSDFAYTDTSVDVLGYVLEVVSGMPLDKLLQKNLYEPLGMVDSSFYPPEAALGRIPSMYWGGGPGTPAGKLGTWWARDFEFGGFGCCPLGLQGVLGKNKKWFSGAGGIFSTSYDFFRFAQMMLNKGVLDGKRVLSEQAVARMTTNQIGNLKNSFWANDWGYMLDIQEDNVAKPPFDHQNGSLGAFGWMGAAGTRWYANPAEDTIVIVMTQTWFLWNVLPATERIVNVVNGAVK